MEAQGKGNGFKETEIGSLPDDWEAVKFEDGIFKKRVKAGKIKQQEFKEIGKYPVIDQGQNFIAGYTDEELKVYKGDLPVIVFGDHTRIFKFVNFSFVCGADGVKIILPNKSKFDPLFLFFALLNLQIPSRGYNRHYPLLKEKRVPHPSIPEQQKISFVLSKIQQAIEQQDKIIEATRNLKKSLMQKLFTEGIRHTEFKDSEIGQIPKSWEVVSLGELAEVRKEVVLPTQQSHSIFIGLEHIEPGSVRISRHGYPTEVKSSKFKFYSEDILYGKLRPYLDKAALAKFDGICSTDIIVIRANTRTIASFLVNRMHQKDFVSYTTSTMTGVNHPRTSWFAISGYRVGLPPLTEQKEIVQVLVNIDNKLEVEEKRKVILQQLFKTMLHKLMTGEIRVKDLDLGVKIGS